MQEEDIQKCQKVFANFDHEGQGAISTQDLAKALEELHISLDEKELFKLIYEVDEKNTGVIEFGDFLNLYKQLNLGSLQDDNQDIIDAFVAIGGNEDGSGQVQRSKIIEIIKKEFQLTIDIEKLIDEVDLDGSGEIEFEEFKTLLSNNGVKDE